METTGNVNVIINGTHFETEALNVTIPTKYRPEFEGHSFKTMTEFSKAIMFASCAAEAFDHQAFSRYVRDEKTLRNILKNGW